MTPRSSDAALSTFLDQLGAKTPTPGGGAAAGVCGALAAALAQMVVNYSVGKKSLAEHEPVLRAALTRLERTRAVMLELADEDAQAYGRLNTLMKLPETDPSRRVGWSAAVALCIQVPRAMLAASLDALRLMEDLATGRSAANGGGSSGGGGAAAGAGGRINRQLKSDLAIAAVLAEAAARASIHNTRINLGLLDSDAERRTIETDLARSISEAVDRAKHVESACSA